MRGLHTTAKAAPSSGARTRSLWLLVCCAVLAAPARAGDDVSAEWQNWESDLGDVRRVRFAVADGRCAYETLADPLVLDVALEHVEGTTIHTQQGGFQDLTITERFWPVGLVQSRYHRTVDGRSRVEWKLIEGRQAVHDGYWVVRPEGHAAVVEFQNTIGAKRWLDQPILRAIQVRTMASIVEAVVSRCGGQPPRPMLARD